MSAPELEGRRALVTGAGSGIGAAIARGLAAAGARVAVLDVNADAAAAVAQEIGGTPFTVDIADAAAVAATVEAAAQQLGGAPEILINNAGVVAGGGPFLDLDPAILDAVLQTNVRGTWLMTQAASRAMVAAGAGGAIVNISSIGGRPTPGLGHYEATKAAVDAITRTAAIELAPHGIRVNGVAPGPVLTPLTEMAMQMPGAREAWEARIPLGRIADPADLLPLVLLLCSAAASHVTGVVVPVDGGQLLT
jgi:NAD(P)-dependent dehydrogenase (short-subunit alcohol dehydrogenase family)